MRRCTLVSGIARSDAVWTHKLSFESACLDWQVRADAFVHAGVHAGSMDRCGACLGTKHPQWAAASADVPV